MKPESNLKRLSIISLSLCGVVYGMQGKVINKDQNKQKPNILILWGDDIGIANISYNNKGLMGYPTPNIDRIAKEGISFTDYYGQQSCTAGRSAFIGGNNPIRTGMTKVGMPGAHQGWQSKDVTLATILKSQGYATGQFGKNHLGDRDEYLPTMHGFDVFLGNLYHLDAEEEPEDEDYPIDNKQFVEKYKPRGILMCKSDGKGGQIVQDLGSLTKKRMETIDDETSDAAITYIKEQVKAGKPFFVWWNGTRMHFRTHVREEHRHRGNDEYTDGMIEHDVTIGKFLKVLDDLGIADNTIVQYSTDNGPQFNTWPDGGNTPFRSEKNSNWEGAYRVPCFVRWPGHFPSNTTLNGIVSHEDWLPTLSAVVGLLNIKEELYEGTTIGEKYYRNYIDGYNLLDYLTGKESQSPRKEFIYATDEGEIACVRTGDWKVVFIENRGVGYEVWREPLSYLRDPLLFNLRRDPYERAQHESNTYNDWMVKKAYIIYDTFDIVASFAKTLEDFPPSQTPGSWSIRQIVK